MSDRSFVVGTLTGLPALVGSNGQRVVQATLECGWGRRVLVEGPVAGFDSSAGRITSGVGASLLRQREGRQLVVIGRLEFAPVRLVLEKVMTREKARPVVSLRLGPFLFDGYRRSSRHSGLPEAEAVLLDGQRLRVVLPENVFAQPGTCLEATLSWSQRHGWRSPHRLSNVSVWRPAVYEAEAA
jgi:hypothetical protein